MLYLILGSVRIQLLSLAVERTGVGGWGWPVVHTLDDWHGPSSMGQIRSIVSTPPTPQCWIHCSWRPIQPVSQMRHPLQLVWGGCPRSMGSRLAGVDIQSQSSQGRWWIQHMGDPCAPHPAQWIQRVPHAACTPDQLVCATLAACILVQLEQVPMQHALWALCMGLVWCAPRGSTMRPRGSVGGWPYLWHQCFRPISLPLRYWTGCQQIWVLFPALRMIPCITPRERMGKEMELLDLSWQA